jgi:hypothetical protein
MVVRSIRKTSARAFGLRHENAVLRRQISRVRYQPGDRLWLAALSRLISAAGRLPGRRRTGPPASAEQPGFATVQPP